MEMAFTEMDIDEWELLCNKNSHTIVQELVFPSRAGEEEVPSLVSSIKQQELTAIQPEFQATEVESDDEVVEEDAVEDGQAQFSNYEKQSEGNAAEDKEEEEEEEDDEEVDDEQVTTFEGMADIASDGKSETITFTEEDDEEEAGEMVEYTGPEYKEKSGCNAFRLRNLLRSVGLAAATFSIFILQKSMPMNQKIQFKTSKYEKAKQLFQHQEEVSKPMAATAHSSYSGHFDECY